jgi:hypothetical protein
MRQEINLGLRPGRDSRSYRSQSIQPNRSFRTSPSIDRPVGSGQRRSDRASSLERSSPSRAREHSEDEGNGQGKRIPRKDWKSADFKKLRMLVVLGVSSAISLVRTPPSSWNL